jgi:methionyl-tRNA synthetase
VVPDGGDHPGPISAEGEDEGFINDINAYLSTYVSNMESLRLRDSLEVVMRLSARGNLYLQQAGLSNALLAENPQRCDQVLHRAVNLIWVLSALIWPFMPATAESIEKQLNVPSRSIPIGGLSNDLLGGHRLGTPEHLFKKIDEGMGEAWRAKFGGGQKPQAAAGEKVAAATAIAGNPKGGAAAQGKKAAGKAKKAAKKAAEEGYPDTEGVRAAKEKVEKQGALVRDLKAKKGEGPDEIEELEKAVKDLLSLKDDLAAEVENAKAEQSAATSGAPTGTA